jgi:hypothetical protein
VFIGHFAVGYAAKRFVPRISLAVLFLAALFADVLWPVLVLLGIEEVRITPGATAFTPLSFVSYPWSHSLLTLLVWGALLGGAYRGIFGGRRSFVVIVALVISHWGLDWLTHAPDMPLYPYGATYGAGLWNSVPLTMAVELALFAGGIFFYTRSTVAKDSIGRWGFLSLAVTLTVLYLVDSLSGQVPPSVNAICFVGLAMSVVFPLWAWWSDRHRVPSR